MCRVSTQWQLLDACVHPAWMFFHKQAMTLFTDKASRSPLIREMFVSLWKWLTLKSGTENLNCDLRGKWVEGIAEVKASWQLVQIFCVFPVRTGSGAGSVRGRSFLLACLCHTVCGFLVLKVTLLSSFYRLLYFVTGFSILHVVKRLVVLSSRQEISTQRHRGSLTFRNSATKSHPQAQIIDFLMNRYLHS